MFITVKASRFGWVEGKEEDIHGASYFGDARKSILTGHIIMRTKVLLLLIVVLIVVYVMTRPREGMCAATAQLTENAVRKACAEQNGVYDETTQTCNCPNGTV
jgi:hypothetical protein